MSGGLVTLGESMVALRAIDTGVTRNGDRFELDIAGAESNVAVGVARLGGHARFIGRVGDDAAGRAITRALRGEGVALDLTVDPDRPTGLLFATSPAPGRSRVSYGRAESAGSRLSPDDLPFDAITDAGLVHLTGITLALSASCRAAVESAVGAAVRAGVPVSLDINYRSKLWSREQAAETLLPLIAHVDFLFAGIDEAQLLLGADASAGPEALADALNALGARTVIITGGPEGSWVREPDGTRHRQPALVTTVVDSTGAGDAFVAGFLADTLLGAPIADRLLTAAACGARACEVRGDWRNAPTRAELAALAAAASSDPIDR